MQTNTSNQKNKSNIGKYLLAFAAGALAASAAIYFCTVPNRTNSLEKLQQKLDEAIRMDTTEGYLQAAKIRDLIAAKK